MANEDRIELIMEGPLEEDGRLRLATFTSQLQKLAAALNKLDREANNGRELNVFQIAEISFNSPLRVVLEPKAIAGQPSGHLVVERLKDVTDAILSGADLSDVDATLLEDLKALSAPVGRTLKTATLIFNGSAIDFNPQITLRLEEALAIEEECHGSIEGDLDQINIHEGANTFHLYPLLGPRRVTCNFAPHLFDDAIGAVGRRVEVFGTLRYRVRASFPHQIAVDDLEVLARETELPDWEDLRGRAPNATGLLSSESFVRKLRDAWQ